MIEVIIVVKQCLFCNKKGVSLVFVVLVLMVMSILSVAIFALFTSNIAQAKQQDDSVKAHFVAISGVEVAYGALLQNNRSLLRDYFDKDIGVVITPLTDTVDLNHGTASIVVSRYVKDGSRWILITSTGSLNNSPVQKVVKMHFRLEHPEIQFFD